MNMEKEHLRQVLFIFAFLMYINYSSYNRQKTIRLYIGGNKNGNHYGSSSDDYPSHNGCNRHPGREGVMIRRIFEMLFKKTEYGRVNLEWQIYLQEYGA